MGLNIFFLGNPAISDDTLALRLADLMKDDFSVATCGSVDDFMRMTEGLDSYVIVDVVKDLSDVREISVSELKSSNTVSMHDFDISMYLQLLEKMGELPDVMIIGIPMSGDIIDIEKKVRELLS